ncbi:hypothetical protein AX774_g2732 [Zancudomyces culisetae]|uniref:Uncharacterized protein n=1 Tax=Zancudomyces culisetae TaxID=1213189 RepID=A0A1R1PS26_ZANCU|nr:hypothetical protein AX774_g2732 [Zancudomyces culisetae]|eukprot:OMH83767.1 hypothetical protein AX774_g2732 [Zancudomyces culisetae]
MTLLNAYNAPLIPTYFPLSLSGTKSEILKITNDNRPAAPNPAINLAIISIPMLVDNPHNKQPTSKINVPISSIILFSKISASLQYIGWKTVDVNKNEVATHDIIENACRFVAIVGRAVETTVLLSETKKYPALRPTIAR